MTKPYNSVSKLDRLIAHYEKAIDDTTMLINDMQKDNDGSTAWVEQIRALYNDIAIYEGKLSELLDERERGRADYMRKEAH